jgi:ATP adenylyltransferase
VAQSKVYQPHAQGSNRTAAPEERRKGLASYTAQMDRLFTPWRYAYITGTGERAQKKGVPAKLSAWPGDLDCVFCNMLAAADYAIANGMAVDEAEEAIFLLARRKTCFVMLNAFPYNAGHLMVVPYEHRANLAEVPLATAEEMMLELRRAERALRSVYRPDGLNMGLNLGESAGAGVASHLHFHAVPRWTGDSNFMTTLAETRVLPEVLGESWRRVRSALAAESSAEPASGG